MSTFKLLPPAVRLETRSFARRTLLDAEGDPIVAKRVVEQQLKTHLQKKCGSIVATFLISLAIKLAIELIVYWVKQNFMTVPDGAFAPGEPGS